MGKDKHAEHMAMNEKAWDAYQAFYNERLGPDYPEDAFADGQVHLEEAEARLAGDVTGLTVLDVCCASFADEVFSWENLGARAIGCDLSPTAIAIARQNAVRLNSRAEFLQCDSQELAPIADGSIDLVYAHYLCWFEDIDRTMQSWFRVTRPGGRLLISQSHPLTECLEADGGGYRTTRKYDDESPEYYQFTGTPAAAGRWKGPYHPIVEFFHPTWRIVNAILDTGYQLLRMEEVCGVGDEGQRGDLPDQLYLLARKPEASP